MISLAREVQNILVDPKGYNENTLFYIHMYFYYDEVANPYVAE